MTTSRLVPIAVSIKDAADMVGLSEDTLRAAINKGALPAKKSGRVIRIRVTALEDWFDALDDVAFPSTLEEALARRRVH